MKMQDIFYKMSYRDTFTDSPAAAQNIPISQSENFKSINVISDSDKLLDMDEEQVQLNQLKQNIRVLKKEGSKIKLKVKK